MSKIIGIGPWYRTEQTAWRSWKAASRLLSRTRRRAHHAVCRGFLPRTASAWSVRIAKRQAVTTPTVPSSPSSVSMGTNYRMNIDGKAYTPQDISAMILTKMKENAEAIWRKVTQASSPSGVLQ